MILVSWGKECLIAEYWNNLIHFGNLCMVILFYWNENFWERTADWNIWITVEWRTQRIYLKDCLIELTSFIGQLLRHVPRLVIFSWRMRGCYWDFMFESVLWYDVRENKLRIHLLMVVLSYQTWYEPFLEFVLVYTASSSLLHVSPILE